MIISGNRRLLDVEVCCATVGRAGCPARLLILLAAVEAPGSRAAVGRRSAIAAATLEAGETAG
jgi:hypothetical protein